MLKTISAALLGLAMVAAPARAEAEEERGLDTEAREHEQITGLSK